MSEKVQEALKRGLPVGLAVVLSSALLFAQEHPATHTVKRGDTLWDLAQRYLSNPFRWPDIYHLNPDVVEDPHWIYPGEVLKLPEGQAGGQMAQAPSQPAMQPGEQGAEPAREAAPSQGQVQQATSDRREAFSGPSLFSKNPPSAGTIHTFAVREAPPSPPVTTSDFYGAAFLADPASVGPTGRTVGKIQENVLHLSLPPSLRLYDEVKISLGGLSASEGQMLQAVRWSHGVGGYRVALPMALVKVTRVEGDSARVRVVQLFDNYQAGDALVEARSFEPRPGVEPAKVEEGMTARVIGFGNAVRVGGRGGGPRPLYGLGEQLFLDKGSEDGVQAGDEFATFSPDVGDATSVPAQDHLAIVRVVRTETRTSTAMLVAMKDPGTTVGAPARMVRQMPERSE